MSCGSSLQSAGLQTGDKELLAADEHDQHWDKACHRHGKDIAPLCELVLAEEAGNRNGQGPLGVVVDDRHGPGEFLPGGEEVEDADGCDSRAGERQNDS